MKDYKMKFYFGLCLTFFIFFNNISYGQNYECDNNYSDCGTPDQSGGGGGGKGSILIANTDLGDSYQHADDYDDDGIEDPSDNCMRYPNPEQFDRDGDSVGDACDNCLEVYNPYQKNHDGDSQGDLCDDDIDNDEILNQDDSCPYHWGEDCIELSINVNDNQIDNYISSVNTEKESNQYYITTEKIDSCDQRSETVGNLFLVMIVVLLFIVFS